MQLNINPSYSFNNACVNMRDDIQMTQPVVYSQNMHMKRYLFVCATINGYSPQNNYKYITNGF